MPIPAHIQQFLSRRRIPIPARRSDRSLTFLRRTCVQHAMAMITFCCACASSAFAVDTGKQTAQVQMDDRVQQLAPRIELISWHSSVLNRRCHYCAVLPDGWTRDGRDWPVLYLLHGRGRHCRSLVDEQIPRTHLLRADFVIILPDGDDGWYIDSPVAIQQRYAAYLDELMVGARQRYSLAQRRELQGITGWSMGGYGSVRFAVSHPGQFGVVSSIIGLLDFPRDGLPEGQSYAVPERHFGADPAEWKKLNPLKEAEQLRGCQVLIVTGDSAFDRTMNENFHQRLTELQIDHEWQVLSGGHRIELVWAALPLVINHAGRSFREAQATDSERRSVRP